MANDSDPDYDPSEGDSDHEMISETYEAGSGSFRTPKRVRKECGSDSSSDDASESISKKNRLVRQTHNEDTSLFKSSISSPTDKDTLQHNISSGSVQIYQCSSCYLQTFQRGYLKSHIKSCKGIKYDYHWKCHACKTVCQLRKLVKVRDEGNNIEFFQCPSCPFKANNSLQVDLLAKIHQANRPYRCPRCKVHLIGIDNFKNHLKSSHSVALLYKCEYCQYSNLNSEKLEEHKKSHSALREIGLIQCSHCNLDFFTMREAQEHMQRVKIGLKRKEIEEKIENLSPSGDDGELNQAKNRQQVLDWTLSDDEDKTENVALDKAKNKEVISIEIFTDSDNELKKNNDDMPKLKTQLLQKRKDIMNNKYVCSQPNCSYSTDNKKSLIRHERMEQNLKKSEVSLKDESKLFKCNECSYKSRYMTHLTIHRQLYHENLGKNDHYECPLPECYYRSSVRSTYKIHLLYLHKLKAELFYPKELKCSDCWYEATKPQNLAWHRLCFHSMRFTRLTVLELRCQKCDFVTTHGRKLLRHMKTNHPVENSDWQTMYKCTRCEVASPYRRNIIRHLKNIHNTSGTARQYTVDTVLLERSTPKRGSKNTSIMTPSKAKNQAQEDASKSTIGSVFLTQGKSKNQKIEANESEKSSISKGTTSKKLISPAGRSRKNLRSMYAKETNKLGQYHGKRSICLNCKQCGVKYQGLYSLAWHRFKDHQDKSVLKKWRLKCKLCSYENFSKLECHKHGLIHNHPFASFHKFYGKKLMGALYFRYKSNQYQLDKTQKNSIDVKKEAESNDTKETPKSGKSVPHFNTSSTKSKSVPTSTSDKPSDQITSIKVADWARVTNKENNANESPAEVKQPEIMFVNVEDIKKEVDSDDMYFWKKSEEYFTCSKCTYETKSKSNLPVHELLVHADRVRDENNKYLCPQSCGFETKYRHSIRRHLEQVHKCDVKEYFLPSSDSSHEKQNKEKEESFVGPDGKHRCPHCEFESIFQRSLSHHLSRQHKKESSTSKSRSKMEDFILDSDDDMDNGSHGKKEEEDDCLIGRYPSSDSNMKNNIMDLDEDIDNGSHSKKEEEDHCLIGRYPSSDSNIKNNIMDLDEDIDNGSHSKKGKKRLVLTCKYCPQLYDDRYKLDVHLYRYHSNKIELYKWRIQCTLCSYRTPLKTIAKKHVQTKHSGPDEAGTVTFLKYYLGRREGKFTFERKQPKYICKKCKFETFTLYRMKKHAMVHGKTDVDYYFIPSGIQEVEDSIEDEKYNAEELLNSDEIKQNENIEIEMALESEDEEKIRNNQPKGISYHNTVNESLNDDEMEMTEETKNCRPSRLQNVVKSNSNSKVNNKQNKKNIEDSRSKKAQEGKSFAVDKAPDDDEQKQTDMGDKESNDESREVNIEDDRPKQHEKVAHSESDDEQKQTDMDDKESNDERREVNIEDSRPKQHEKVVHSESDDEQKQTDMDDKESNDEQREVNIEDDRPKQHETVAHSESDDEANNEQNQDDIEDYIPDSEDEASHQQNHDGNEDSVDSCSEDKSNHEHNHSTSADGTNYVTKCRYPGCEYHKKMNKYKCPRCTFNSSTRKEMNKHIKEVHGVYVSVDVFADSIRCQKCKKKRLFKSKMAYAKHMVKKHRDNTEMLKWTIKCTLCGFKSQTRKGANGHAKRIHANFKEAVVVEFQRFYEKKFEGSYEFKCEKRELYKCTECDFVTSGPRYLYYHSKKHGKPNFKPRFSSFNDVFEQERKRLLLDAERKKEQRKAKKGTTEEMDSSDEMEKNEKFVPRTKQGDKASEGPKIGPLNCRKCSAIYYSQYPLSFHMFLDHQDKAEIEKWRFDCTLCDFRTHTKKGAAAHARRKHSDPEQPRMVEFETFYKNQFEFTHKYQCDKKKERKLNECSECEFACWKVEYYKRHLEKYHNPDSKLTDEKQDKKSGKDRRMLNKIVDSEGKKNRLDPQNDGNITQKEDPDSLDEMEEENEDDNISTLHNNESEEWLEELGGEITLENQDASEKVDTNEVIMIEITPDNGETSMETTDKDLLRLRSILSSDNEDIDMEDNDYDVKLDPYKGQVVIQDSEENPSLSLNHSETITLTSQEYQSKSDTSPKNENKSNRTFKCNLCQKMITNWRLLQEHTNVHSETLNKPELVVTFSEFSRNKFFCKLEIKAKTKSCAKTKQASEITFKCWICGAFILKQESLQNHTNIHARANKNATLKVRYSKFCDDVVESTIVMEADPNCLNKSKRREKDDDDDDEDEFNPDLPVFNCGECNFKTNKEGALNKHKNLHWSSEKEALFKAQKYFTCDVCFFHCFDDHTLKEHKEWHKKYPNSKKKF